MEFLDITYLYGIRKQDVALDSDIARVFETKIKIINKIVRENPECFPEDLSFVLTEEEARMLNIRRDHVRVFTEKGFYMLSTFLDTKPATLTHIKFIEDFTDMCHKLEIDPFDIMFGKL